MSSCSATIMLKTKNTESPSHRQLPNDALVFNYMTSSPYVFRLLTVTN